MKKSSLVLLAGVVFLTLTKVAQGQSGCTDSPENPTAILAVAGVAGAIVSSGIRRLRTRRIDKIDH